SPNGVLYLPRDGSYATLPSFLFQSLTNATIECWAQYHSADHPVVFDFGLLGSELWTQRGEQDLVTFAYNVGKGEIRNNVPGVLRTNASVHLAMVTGAGGLRGYVNGVLMVTNPAKVSFASTINRTNYLGRDTVREMDQGRKDLVGFIDN